MSSEPESTVAAASVAPESLDLTGLPPTVAAELRRLVATLRESLAHAPSLPGSAAPESPGVWAQRLQAWVDSHPTRAISIDDCRQSLYAGRGE